MFFTRIIPDKLVNYKFFCPLSPPCHQFDKMTTKANQYVDELRANKEEGAELKRLINRVQREIENMTAEVSRKTKSV